VLTNSIVQGLVPLTCNGNDCGSSRAPIWQCSKFLDTRRSVYIRAHMQRKAVPTQYYHVQRGERFVILW